MRTSFNKSKSLIPINLTIAVLFLLLTAPISLAQSSEIQTVEIVRSLSGNADEALYFYENNWKIFRQKALQENNISDFNLLVSDKDSIGNIEILLITEYENKDQFDKREENFRRIIEETGSSMPSLKNAKKPGEFRVRIYSNTLYQLTLQPNK